MQFLISAEWLQQEAKARGVTATPAEVRTTFEAQKKQAFPKQADYLKFLKSSGRTEADLMFQVRLSVLTNKLQMKVVEGKGNVSNKQIADYYAKNKQRFAQPESRDLLVVLTKDQGKAKQALAQLKAHKAWKDVASKFSIDTASKSQGGKLPGVTRGTQEKAFDTAIFGAKVGQIQGPVKTQFGYYVFQVTKVTPASQQTLAQARPTIKNLLQSQGQQTALNDFVKDFQRRYRDKTVCAKGFVTTQCSNGPKPPAQRPGIPQQGPSGAPPTAGGGPSGGGATPVPPSGAPGGAGGGAPTGP
jgi:foldase protein PrsA